MVKNKLVVILGPTASGKSSLGIKLAKKFKGEIISADSRQVYKGLDIGTGKVTKKEQQTVPHHLLDVTSPKRQYTVSMFKKTALKKIKEIQKRGHLPFIVGGTAFYIYSVIDDLQLPNIKPDLKLRKKLGNRTTAQLFQMLKKLDPRRALTIDKNNPHRLIRAIEIIKTTGNTVPVLKRTNSDSIIIGVKQAPDKLKASIRKRVSQRLKTGLVKEVEKLKKSGISSKRFSELGLTYAIVNQFLLGKIEKDKLVELITSAEYKYSKRQMTWFKRDERIRWVKNQNEAERLIKKLH